MIKKIRESDDSLHDVNTTPQYHSHLVLAAASDGARQENKYNCTDDTHE